MSESFEEFWNIYPRKIAKGAARKAYTKALELTDAATIYYGAGAYKAATENEDPKYIKHPATWLNAEGWCDVYEVKVSWGKVTYTAEKMRQREEQKANVVRLG